MNVFHARVDGSTEREDAAFLLGEIGIEDVQRASIYVRPHRLEVSRRRTRPDDLRARVERVHAAGPTVKVELATESGSHAQAELSQEQFEALRLVRGDEVFVHPREKRVYLEDYSI